MLCSSLLIRHLHRSSSTIFSHLSSKTSVSLGSFDGLRIPSSTRRLQLSALRPNVPSAQNSPDSPAKLSPPKQEKSALDMVKGFYGHYGYTALTFHTGVAAMSLAFWVLLVRSPVDVSGFMAQIGVLTPLTLLITKTATSFGAGSFAVGYLLHKVTGPIRVLITILATPALVRKYGGRTAEKVTQAKKSP
ncbi:hypothetical protein RvY_06779 [Ramazzottius varieornatus]|uniref:DUF1279 domain-containing protein n=1 Tax=Ramazzottius varieornatus TaxID=947166 RepID=A0A1D1V8E9_RAMVA|nr:hypothetical protein RvY_06779 [Ramazzottius varieornatus]